MQEGPLELAPTQLLHSPTRARTRQPAKDTAMPSSERKKIRLPESEYRGQKSYFVTTCCEDRRKVFAEAGRAEWIIERSLNHAKVHQFAIHAYCVMPDHFHFLAEGRSDSSDLIRFVSQFKQQTAHEFGSVRGRLWQRYFYDHILRGRDGLDAVAWYIWMNPVRKGLCKEPEDYPFSGSMTVEWKRKKRPEGSWTPPWNDRQGEKRAG